MRSINLGVLGLGTVGGGVYRLLVENKKLIEERVGFEVTIKKILEKNEARLKELKVPKEIVAGDFDEIARDREIDVVVELIGGISPAREFITDSLNAKKHVVTANKALLAECAPTLIEVATANKVRLEFEASVAGGIPILRALCEGLSANKIEKIMGIINGTCNYILTEMSEKGEEFSKVLAEAQAKGFAEADPSFDVDGIDTAHKLAILVSLAYGGRCNYKEVFTEGIRGVTPLDIDIAKKFGYVIKLLAIAKENGGKIQARVHPTMLPEGTMLAKVGGVFNAVSITGNAVGETVFYGRGAGAMPTASAVLSDVIAIARGTTGIARSFSGKISLLPMEKISSKYYFRFYVIDKPGVFAKIATILGDNNISIKSVYQHEMDVGAKVPVVVMTHEAREEDVTRALDLIDKLDVVLDRTLRIRVEDGG